MSVAAVRYFTAALRSGGNPYHIVKIDYEGHRVEVTLSPTGRSISVYVDDQPCVKVTP